jgi:hypothetical protein
MRQIQTNVPARSLLLTLVVVDSFCDDATPRRLLSIADFFRFRFLVDFMRSEGTDGSSDFAGESNCFDIDRLDDPGVTTRCATVPIVTSSSLTALTMSRSEIVLNFTPFESFRCRRRFAFSLCFVMDNYIATYERCFFGKTEEKAE